MFCLLHNSVINYASYMYNINLGPTLKLKRFFVMKKYAATINAMYSDTAPKELVSKL